MLVNHALRSTVLLHITPALLVDNGKDEEHGDGSDNSEPDEKNGDAVA